MDSGAVLLVLVVGEDALLGGLERDAEVGVLLEEFAHVVRGKWGATLPYTLVLSSYSNSVYSVWHLVTGQSDL